MPPSPPLGEGGIGLDGHEWPYLVKGSDLPLRPGMTSSDERGIYQSG
ncbi:MAG: hypothetical protein ACN0LA_11930 [Candidatus Longimicrobiales bacterium M2_2A_002]